MVSALCLIEIELTQFEGPSRGRPMQLPVMDKSGGGVEKEQLTPIAPNSTKGKGKRALTRSECLLTNRVCLSIND